MTTDTFSITKNVADNFFISVSSSYISAPTNYFVRITDTILMVATPNLTINSSVDLDIVPLEIIAVSDSAVQGGETTYDTLSTNCAIVQGRTDSFTAPGIGFWIGTETTWI